MKDAPLPVNGHLLIEPIKRKSFFGDEKYQEVGVVKAQSDEVPYDLTDCLVFFDSWLAGKFPKPDGADEEFYWLVRWADIKAIQGNVPDEISS